MWNNDTDSSGLMAKITEMFFRHHRTAAERYRRGSGNASRGSMWEKWNPKPAARWTQSKTAETRKRAFQLQWSPCSCSFLWFGQKNSSMQSMQVSKSCVGFILWQTASTLVGLQATNLSNTKQNSFTYFEASVAGQIWLELLIGQHKKLIVSSRQDHLLRIN